jgi:hypothetical protein
MIKRLFIIAIVTGIGHLTTLFSLKYVSKFIDKDTIAFIGEIDSLTLLIVSIVAFGLQLSTTRNIAIQTNWKEELYETQSARLTLATIIMIFGISGFLYSKNYMFLIAPVISLNADYALYGRGKPIHGAFIAFIRIVIPSFILIIASIYFKEQIALLFSISLFITYLISGILVSLVLKTSYFVIPKIKNLKKYLDNFTIGLASFALFFIGIGIINIMSYFYTSESIAVVYIVLKLYMIFKGVRRIITQSFFKELQEIEVSLKVDFLAVVAGLIFLLSIIVYPKVIIPLLFEAKYITYNTTFTLLGIAGFISSFTTSSGTRLLLKKWDFIYSRNLIFAAIFTIISGLVFWFFFGDEPYLIALSVLLGEIIISVLNIKSLNEKDYMLLRIKSTMKLIVPTFLFILFAYFLGQKLYVFSISLLIFGIWVLISSRRNILRV